MIHSYKGTDKTRLLTADLRSLWGKGRREQRDLMVHVDEWSQGSEKQLMKYELLKHAKSQTTQF